MPVKNSELQPSISQEIHFLGNILGEVIQQISGNKVYEIEERVRELSKDFRTNQNETSFEKLKQAVAELSPTIAYEVALAFTTYFELVNIAEENHRIRILRARERDGVPIKESFQAAREELSKNLAPEELNKILGDLCVDLVFTAHPTEIKRRTILSKLYLIAETLISSNELKDAESLVRKEVTSLWMSSRTREEKPSILEEVRTCLWYFSSSIQEAVSELREKFNEPALKTWIRFGSWVGGDRDGHPEVKAETTLQTLALHRSLGLETISSLLEEAAELLSISKSRDEFSDGLLDQISSWAEEEALKDIVERYSIEPYRAYLKCLIHKLPEMSTRELKAHLQQIKSSLTTYSKTKGLLLKPIDELNFYLRHFGSGVARLDIRQESTEHSSGIDQVLKRLDVSANYNSLSEEAKLDLLSKLLSNENPAEDFSSFAEDSAAGKVLKPLIELAKLSAPELGVYVISMTHSASDFLEPLLLMKWAGLKMPIVPLFETRKDLQEAHEILDQAFSNAEYRQHLESLGSEQMVMLGYSDSNKDAGYLAANWEIFKAQSNIATLCRAKKVQLEFFHGRGGTVSRGGGPAARAILSQPMGMLSGKIRITEQGEILSTRYQRKEIAKRVIEQNVYGALLASAEARKGSSVSEAWSEMFEEMAEVSAETYSKLVKGDEGFIPFWNQITPIDFIKTLKIGSRPSSRRPTEAVEDLRAIPWVFSWLQTRFVITGWFGMGTAFESQSAKLADLQTMYREWPFFKSVIDNAQLTLAKTDLSIGKLYMELDPSEESPYFKILEDEYKKAESWILKITKQKEILESEQILQKSVKLRNPYIDPLNFIQVEMIKRYRESSESDDELRDELLKVIQLTISGISAGLRNTG